MCLDQNVSIEKCFFHYVIKRLINHNPLDKYINFNPCCLLYQNLRIHYETHEIYEIISTQKKRFLSFYLDRRQSKSLCGLILTKIL